MTDGYWMPYVGAGREGHDPDRDGVLIDFEKLDWLVRKHLRLSTPHDAEDLRHPHFDFIMHLRELAPLDPCLPCPGSRISEDR